MTKSRARALRRYTEPYSIMCAALGRCESASMTDALRICCIIACVCTVAVAIVLHVGQQIVSTQQEFHLKRLRKRERQIAQARLDMAHAKERALCSNTMLANHRVAVPDLVWCHGIDFAACDIHPTKWQVDPRGPYEHGDINWTTAIIPNASVLCVPSTDIPDFLPRFLSLPASYRVSVVSNQEDVGLPREVFGLGGPRHLAALHEGRRIRPRDVIGLGDFLADPRLVHWWVLNYDFLGCNPYSGCAEAEWSAPERAALVAKVSPMPIGVDLHSMDDPAKGHHGLAASSACQQARKHEALRAALPPFKARPARLIAPFACQARGGRNDVCNALRRCPALLCARRTTSRLAFWRSLGNFSFVASPFGRGIDSHRTWEALSLGAVPVVLASSVDALLARFPVVRLSNWSEVLEPHALERWKRDIQRRFGDEPFGPSMRRRLTTSHWARRIRQKHALGLGSGAFPFDTSPRMP